MILCWGLMWSSQSNHLSCLFMVISGAHPSVVTRSDKNLYPKADRYWIASWETLLLRSWQQHNTSQSCGHWPPSSFLHLFVFLPIFTCTLINYSTFPMCQTHEFVVLFRRCVVHPLFFKIRALSWVLQYENMCRSLDATARLKNSHISSSWNIAGP